MVGARTERELGVEVNGGDTGQNLYIFETEWKSSKDMFYVMD